MLFRSMGHIVCTYVYIGTVCIQKNLWQQQVFSWLLKKVNIGYLDRTQRVSLCVIQLVGILLPQYVCYNTYDLCINGLF